MSKHIHAESMRLYAEDAMETCEPGYRWQFRRPNDDEWLSCNPDSPEWIPEYEYRRKPQTIRVNGVEVPKPLTELPESGIIFVPDFYCGLIAYKPIRIPYHNMTPELAIKRGIAHSSEEAAIAHAEAMLLRDVE